MLPLTGTTDSLHMRQNLDVFDFTLSDEDLKIMLELGML
jgi:diketogulonate reductase-like aldo/keto reductase